MLLSSALILPALLCLGCDDGHSPLTARPLERPAPFAAMVAAEESLPVAGCAAFTVDVSNPAEVTIAEAADPGCERVRPVVEGAATFDAVSRILRIPLAIQNGGHTPLEVPAFLTSADNLLDVIGGAGVGDEGLLVFLNADSSEVAVGGGEEVVRYFWRYDEEFPDPALEAGDRSGPRVIEIVVDPTVETLRIEMQAQAMIPAEWAVPAVPPDTLPDWVYERRVSDSPVMSGTFLENVLFLVFRPGTSQAERQAAVDSVRGRVVGGIRDFDDDGYYVVLIEDDHPDVPGQALLEAMDALSGQAQVDLATPEFVFQNMDLYRRPGDGPGWESGDWALRTESASGGKWGLERIAAPLGWGCSTGDDALNVAVVDGGFHGVPDVAANLRGSFGLGVFPDTADHGTEVAAVLAARGDNDSLMTGTMWREVPGWRCPVRTFGEGTGVPDPQ